MTATTREGARPTRAPAKRRQGKQAKAGARKGERLDEALRAALDLHNGSAARWGLLTREGATDPQIWGALLDEFGSGGSSQSEGGVLFAFAGGSPTTPPKFWIDTSNFKTQDKPTLAGAPLVRKVRELLSIPKWKREIEYEQKLDEHRELIADEVRRIERIESLAALQELKIGLRARGKALGDLGVDPDSNDWNAETWHAQMDAVIRRESQLKQKLAAAGEGDGALDEAHAAAIRAAERRQLGRWQRLKEIDDKIRAGRLRKSLRAQLDAEKGAIVAAFRGEQLAVAANFGDDEAAAIAARCPHDALAGEGLVRLAHEGDGPPDDDLARLDAATRGIAEIGDRLAASDDGAPTLSFVDRARLARLGLTLRRLKATVAELDERIGKSKGNLKGALENQRANTQAAFELELHNAHNSDGFPLDVLEPLRERVESGAELTLDELEAHLVAVRSMINARDAEINDPRTKQGRRKQLRQDRAPYDAEYSNGLAELIKRLGDEDATAAQERIEARAEGEHAQAERARQLSQIEGEQAERFARLLEIDAEITRDGIKPKEREAFERERGRLRGLYVAAFRDVAARWDGGEADALRLRVEKLPELSEGERTKLLGELEAAQRERWGLLVDLDRQLTEHGPAKTKRRAALTKERAKWGATYARSYAAALGRLGVKVIEDLRAKIEGDAAPPIFAAPATSGAGARVEADPTLTFSHKCEIQLDERDVAERARRLANLHGEHSRITKEKETAAARFKAELGALDDESKKLFDEILAGVAVAEFKVYERRDYGRKVVEFVRAGTTDQVVGSRAMKARELTPRLFT